MQIIAIEFTARRYHATPWDAHVNEGRIEWPPAPWRLLRALLAVGYSKLGWEDSIPPTAEALLQKMASTAPCFFVPEATESHTRHYMPIRKGKSEGTAKVFDAFLRFSEPDKHKPDERLLIRYDIELSNEEHNELKSLVEGLAYLGRAEAG